MHILVTAGPTREFFDTVRFISNPSSGRMGYAIAGEAVRRGHEVVLVSGPVDRSDPPGVRIERVVSAAEMFDASVAAFETCDAAIMTAAVCDYRPSRRLDHKLKKQARVRPIQLQPTQDICAHLGKIKAGRVVIGFAMEDRDHRTHAEAKLKRKCCDAIILNGLANVGGDGAEIEVLTAGEGWTGPFSGSKVDMAGRVVDLVERLSGRC
jgi:phosphopantothenoylcysteine decarboxylase / phosphopantothenate---cysteine ligase